MRMFTLVQKVVEEVPAWEECDGCGGAGKCCNRGSIPITCPYCNGLGGKWHEAVIQNQTFPDKQGYLNNSNVYKPSRLIRKWDVCKECGGTMSKWQIDCPHCHRDADGKPTGAEPDTAGPWRVKE